MVLSLLSIDHGFLLALRVHLQQKINDIPRALFYGMVFDINPTYRDIQCIQKSQPCFILRAQLTESLQVFMYGELLTLLLMPPENPFIGSFRTYIKVDINIAEVA
jgi:hypothetical protein